MSARITALVATALVAVLAAPVVAQEGLDYTYREAEKLSTEQKIERADESIKQMKETLKLALERLQEAREDNDILEVNCVNDKLSAIKGLLKISEQGAVNLQEAAAKGDEDLINHEYTKVSIAAARVENFRVEVEACVGEASQYIGRTELSVQIDGDIREADPSTGEPPPVFPADTVAVDEEGRIPLTPHQ